MIHNNHRFRRTLATGAVIALIAAACSSADTGPSTTEADIVDTAASSTSSLTPTSSVPAPSDQAEDVQEDVEPFVIAMINQEEGVIAYPEASYGARAAVEYVNTELGGVDGHPVELRLCTVSNDPESNQTCAEQFANDDDVDFVTIGGTTNGGPIYETLAAVEKPVIGQAPLSIADLVAPDSYLWSPGVLGVVQTMAIFAVEELGVSSAAVVYADNPAGEAAIQFASGVLDANGVESTMVPVANDEADLIGALTAAGASDADVVLGLLIAPGCIQLANAYTAMALSTPILTTALCTDSTVLDAVGIDALEGWYIATVCRCQEDPSYGDPDVVLYRDVLERYGDGPLELAGLTIIGFANVLRATRFAQDIGFDDVSSSTMRQAALDFTGPVFLGPDEAQCPGAAPFVTVCNAQATVYHIEDGAFVRAGDGQFINPLAYLAAKSS